MIYVIVLVIAIACYIDRPKPKPKPVKQYSTATAQHAPKPINMALLEDLKAQLEATLVLASATDRKANRTYDVLKQARLRKQATDLYVKASKIQTQIDRIEGNETS